MIPSVHPFSDMSKRHGGRRSYLLAACAMLFYAMLCLASPLRLDAQCNKEPHDFCQDSCCLTDVLLVNTGYDHINNVVYPVDEVDPYWNIIQAAEGNGDVPRPADILTIDPSWGDGFARAQWIGPHRNHDDNVPGEVVYQKCFCICGPDDVTVSFSLDVLSTTGLTITIEGQVIGQIPPGGTTQPVHMTLVTSLSPGRHCIEVKQSIDDPSKPAGFDIEGTIEGHGLLKYSCCGDIATPPEDRCLTTHLQLGTDNSWTLLQGPANFGPYPRCADIITTSYYPTWANPVSGTNWIGANPTGSSGPYHPGGDLYVYRKSFCVDKAGTFVITVTSAADDSGAFFLNGVYLGNTGPYNSQVVQTYIVGLHAGCNCLDFRVYDLGFAITGLDALIDIQGATLRNPWCCDCGGCGGGAGDPLDPPSGLIPHRADGPGELSAVRNAPQVDMAMHPTLVSIPNPTTGEAVIHYVIDKDAEAHVILYNTAGERVMVVDEGARTRGEHAVPIATKDLPAGAYRLQLISGETKLSIPLTVR
jgi:hypothetical protein